LGRTGPSAEMLGRCRNDGIKVMNKMIIMKWRWSSDDRDEESKWFVLRRGCWIRQC